MKLLLVVLGSVIIATSRGFPSTEEECGKAVILTPLIEDGRIKKAQQLAKVNYRPFHPVKSYSGYLTVNPDFDSNIFFWYFPAATQPETAPVVLWLQGGPGGSSMYGLFHENGPFYIQDDEIHHREYSWHLNHHVIYIDNPVGTGFSFTRDEDGYARNQTTVGKDLYNAMLQFFRLFPRLQSNDFYVTGESYGGKYVPALCHTIHNNNKIADLKINLKGFAIGNGWVDPYNQLAYGPYLYQLGIIDENQLLSAEKLERKVKAAILAEDYLEAFTLRSLEYSYSSNVDSYNFLREYRDLEPIPPLNKCEVKKAIHAENINYVNVNGKVQRYLWIDFMKSVADWVGELLSHYRGVFYNGQLDIICAYPLTVNFLKHLKFSSAVEYENATRHDWLVDGDIAGFVKTAGNLTEVLVRNAGHSVPTDQPKWAFDLLNKLTSNQPFF